MEVGGDSAVSLIIVRLLTKALNTASARSANVPHRTRNSGGGWFAGLQRRKIMPRAGMRGVNRGSGGLSVIEYCRNKGMAEWGTSCSILSPEKTCFKNSRNEFCTGCPLLSIC